MKTIFCDIDGTLLEHHGDVVKQLKSDPVVLDGCMDKLVEWDRKGYTIILTTGRRESMRTATEKQLNSIGIFYDQLVMGIGSGPRYLINDSKSNGDETAYAIQTQRNEGIKNVEI